MKLKDVAEQRYMEMLYTAFGEQMISLLHDPQVIEVLLNPGGEVFVERLGQGKMRADFTLLAAQAENIVKLVASYKNQVINEDKPSIATDIPILGARFQGWLSPVVSEPTFAIRKRATQIFTLQNYVTQGALTEQAATFLQEAVVSRKNILVVGGTGTGKTTFANALLDVLRGSDERILILEDLPELQVFVEDIVTMNTTNSVSMRDLVKGSLRMRPDRIIVGEVRDGAALELLKAWNTGHPGGICTLHANSVESTPHRLEDLIQEAVVTVPRSLILQAIDIIVYLERAKDGKRAVKAISSLTDYRDQRYFFEKLL